MENVYNLFACWRIYGYPEDCMYREKIGRGGVSADTFYHLEPPGVSCKCDTVGLCKEVIGSVMNEPVARKTLAVFESNIHRQLKKLNESLLPIRLIVVSTDFFKAAPSRKSNVVKLNFQAALLPSRHPA